MNKNELINAIAKGAKLSKKQAGEALEATLNAVKETVRKGQRLALVGFGTFSVGLRKARKGINPKTRQVIKIAAKKVVKFKAGKQLSKLAAKGK